MKVKIRVTPLDPGTRLLLARKVTALLTEFIQFKEEPRNASTQYQMILMDFNELPLYQFQIVNILGFFPKGILLRAGGPRRIALVMDADTDILAPLLNKKGELTINVDVKKGRI
jgi:hypothetical protein